MAQDIEYGGSNGVSILDLGLPGGTRHGAATMRSTMNIIVNPEEVPVQETASPDNDLTVAQKLGRHGMTILGQGLIQANSNSLMDTVLGEIEDHRTGRYNGRSTELRRNVPTPVVTWRRVYLDRFTQLEVRRPSSGGFVGFRYKVIFRVLEV